MIIFQASDLNEIILTNLPTRDNYCMLIHILFSGVLINKNIDFNLLDTRCLAVINVKIENEMLPFRSSCSDCN